MHSDSHCGDESLIVVRRERDDLRRELAAEKAKTRVPPKPTFTAYFCVRLRLNGTPRPEVLEFRIFSSPPQSVTKAHNREAYACLYERDGETYQEALDDLLKCIKVAFPWAWIWVDPSYEGHKARGHLLGLTDEPEVWQRYLQQHVQAGDLVPAINVEPEPARRIVGADVSGYVKPDGSRARPFIATHPEEKAIEPEKRRIDADTRARIISLDDADEEDGE